MNYDALPRNNSIRNLKPESVKHEIENKMNIDKIEESIFESYGVKID